MDTLKEAVAGQSFGQSSSLTKRKPSNLLNCDQVAWLGDVLDRYAFSVQNRNAGVSRSVQAAKLAAMMELFELLDLGFQDKAAAGNAITGFPELYALRQP